MHPAAGRRARRMGRTGDPAPAQDRPGGIGQRHRHCLGVAGRAHAGTGLCWPARHALHMMPDSGSVPAAGLRQRGGEGVVAGAVAPDARFWQRPCRPAALSCLPPRPLGAAAPRIRLCVPSSHPPVPADPSVRGARGQAREPPARHAAGKTASLHSARRLAGAAPRGAPLPATRRAPCTTCEAGRTA